jgi:hypothetical protein
MDGWGGWNGRELELEERTEGVKSEVGKAKERETNE